MYITFLDGGDCNQLCDYNNCTLNVTVIDECISGCNTSYCDYGFDKQCLAQPIGYYGEYDNYTLCEEMTQCDIDDDWIGDGVCDDNCNIDICDYDLGDCDYCDDSSCIVLWNLFSSYSNSIDADNLLSKAELCQGWDVFVQFSDTEIFNCTNSITSGDLDGNGLLNAYEAQVDIARLSAFLGCKYMQVNCSLCFSSVQEYYASWNWSEIIHYTNNNRRCRYVN